MVRPSVRLLVACTALVPLLAHAGSPAPPDDDSLGSAPPPPALEATPTPPPAPDRALEPPARAPLRPPGSPPGWRPNAPPHRQGRQEPLPGEIRFEWRPLHVYDGYGYGPLVQVPVEGPERQELYGRALYDAVGRPDLGAEYGHRRAVRTGLWVASGALIVASVAVSIWAFSESRDCGYYGCRDSTLDNRLWLSGGLLLGGVAFGIGAGAYGPEPVSRGELYQLVRDHNRAVRRAPTDSPDDASAPAPPKPSWVLAPTIGPHGGGLALGVRF